MYILVNIIIIIVLTLLLRFIKGNTKHKFVTILFLFIWMCFASAIIGVLVHFISKYW